MENSAGLRVCVCTIPIRPRPTTFPPFGSMAVIQAIRPLGVHAKFYHLDYFRPADKEIEAYFRENQFDLLGISAVVSTSYTYAKKLAAIVRQVSPKTTILLGGNMAASAEVILRKTEVDYCVQGDGEVPLRNFVRHMQGDPAYNNLASIRGLTFLNDRGELVFTGYETAPSPTDMEEPDFDILEGIGCLPHYITTNLRETALRIQEGKFLEENGKRVTVVISAKGCVARCTFCHRFEKGFRQLPPERVLAHIRYLMERYNVGFIAFGDENFGSDKLATQALVKGLKELGVLWEVTGVRARTVDQKMLDEWRDSGCIAVYYGIESGSQTMLNVMEKNVTVEKNLDALRMAFQAGFHTCIQLVFGMPGETPRTVEETAEFLKKATVYQDKIPSHMFSFNYAQSLPGTPLYEYARHRGMIGRSLDEEEKYLEAISDIDAYSTDHFLNYTGFPMLDVVSWRIWVVSEVEANYFNARLKGPIPFWEILVFLLGAAWGRVRPFRASWRPENPLVRHLRRDNPEAFAKLCWDPKVEDKAEREGYFNIQRSAMFLLTMVYMHPILKRLGWPMVVCFQAAKRTWKKPRKGLAEVAEYVKHHATALLRRAPKPDESLPADYYLPHRSLRAIMKETAGSPDAGMELIRLGR